MSATKPLQSISEFYAGRKIFITGGTGLIGKVLIWKLLNSCSLVEKIYLLIRKRPGLNAHQRKEKLLKSTIFDSFRNAEKVYLLDKIKVIEGDVSCDGLDLSMQDKNILMNEIDLVMYGAALLNMDSSLKQAIRVNTEGVIRTLKIFEERNVLDAFVYISTAYSCCTEVDVQEKLYPMNMDPEDVIRLVKNLPDKALEKITADIINPQPNCYTFSKQVTEAILGKYNYKFPIIIARPTIVLCAVNEPIPGWADTLNGPIGVAVATGKGVLRVMWAHPNRKGDLIPVDSVVNGIIAIPWRDVQQKEEKLSKIAIYNLGAGPEKSITWRQYQVTCEEIALEYPFEIMMWYPNYDVIEPNKLLYEIKSFFYHVIPARIIDSLLFIFRQKRFMIRTQRKISSGLKVLGYFAMREWRFSIDGITEIEQLMSEEDQKEFPIVQREIDFRKYAISANLVMRKAFFNDDIANIGKARFRLKILYAVHIITKILFYYYLIKLFLKLIGVW